MSTSPTDPGSSSAPPAIALHSPGYLLMLLFAAVIGAPLSLVAFAFLATVHELERLVWESLPSALGFAELPAWWAAATLGVAGLLVGLAVRHLPGHGGHVPAHGLAGGITPPSHLPGIVVASVASLVLGAVVGPEAPLIAIGSGLALLSVRRVASLQGSEATAIISAAGSAAAISAIFGNPLVAAVMFLEVMGLGRRQTMLVVLPVLVSSGVGALVFTGLGGWSGLGIGALAIPDLDHAPLALTDVLWALPIAAAVAVGTGAVFVLGRWTADRGHERVVTVTVAAGLAAGASAAVYAVTTGHSPAEVALSGQATLGALATEPAGWSTGALALLLLSKGIAYGLCIGVFRGGPIFPAVFLGAVAGVLADLVLPGTGFVPSLAVGMAAGAAVVGLPVTGVVLVVLLLGDAAASQIPVVILAVVAATIVHEWLTPPTDP